MMSGLTRNLFALATLFLALQTGCEATIKVFPFVEAGTPEPPFIRSNATYLVTYHENARVSVFMRFYCFVKPENELQYGIFKKVNKSSMGWYLNGQRITQRNHGIQLTTGYTDSLRRYHETISWQSNANANFLGIYTCRGGAVDSGISVFFNVLLRCPPLIGKSLNVTRTTSTESGKVVSIGCKSGYGEVSGPVSSATCQPNGNWTRFPTCVVPCAGFHGNHLNTSSSTTVLAGHVLHVSCQKNYVQIGTNVSNVTCQADGRWTQAPRCVATCSTFNLPKWNMTTTIRHVNGTTLAVGCATNYIPTGSPVTSVTCQDDGQWTTFPTCRATCSTFNSPEWNVTTTIRHVNGTTLAVGCATNYIQTGSPIASVTCQDNGQWTTFPTCQATCSPISSPRLSVHVPGRMVEGTTLSIGCESSFLMTGPIIHTITCQRSGTWTSLPTCERSCAPFAQGRFVAGRHVRTLHSTTLNISCGAEYIEQGNTPDITCQSDGTWTAFPVCNASCPAIDISGLNIQTTSRTPVGKAVSVDCLTNYTQVGRRIYSTTCQANGEWTIFPTCFATCPELVSASFNTTVSTRSFNGTTLSIGCAANYILTGSAIASVTCQDNGQWTTFPTCEPSCPPFSKGRYDTSQSVRALHSTTLNISCGDEYIEQGNTPDITCQSDGTWSAFPVCNVSCPMFDIPGLNTKAVIRTLEGTTISVDCLTNYAQIGKRIDSVTCQSNGTWTKFPACVVACPKIVSDSFNTTVSTRSFNGTTLSIGCAASYILTGSPIASVTCQDNGQWTTFPTCEPSCPPFSKGRYDTSQSVRALHSTTQNISCGAEYIEQGNTPDITCQSDGTWTAFPVCNASCPVFDIPLLNMETKTRTVEGTTISVDCRTNYAQTGKRIDSVTCQSNGKWTRFPTCVGTCPELTSASFNTTVSTKSFNGTTLSIGCAANYILTGSPIASITCQEDGQWTTFPTCQATCPSFTVANLLPSTVSQSLNGTIVNVSCESGYELEGESVSTELSVTCQENGEWTALPQCLDIVDCPDACEDSNSVCVDVAGSFQCSCSHGYTGTGLLNKSCTDVDECEATCVGEDFKCVNTQGSYACFCFEGSQLVAVSVDGKEDTGISPNGCNSNTAKQSNLSTGSIVGIVVSVCVGLVVATVLAMVVRARKQTEKQIGQPKQLRHTNSMSMSINRDDTYSSERWDSLLKRNETSCNSAKGIELDTQYGVIGDGLPVAQSTTSYLPDNIYGDVYESIVTDSLHRIQHMTEEGGEPGVSNDCDRKRLPSMSSTSNNDYMVSQPGVGEDLSDYMVSVSPWTMADNNASAPAASKDISLKALDETGGGTFSNLHLSSRAVSPISEKEVQPRRIHASSLYSNDAASTNTTETLANSLIYNDAWNGDTVVNTYSNGNSASSAGLNKASDYSNTDSSQIKGRPTAAELSPSIDNIYCGPIDAEENMYLESVPAMIVQKPPVQSCSESNNSIGESASFHCKTGLSALTSSLTDIYGNADSETSSCVDVVANTGSGVPATSKLTSPVFPSRTGDYSNNSITPSKPQIRPITAHKAPCDNIMYCGPIDADENMYEESVPATGITVSVRKPSKPSCALSGDGSATPSSLFSKAELGGLAGSNGNIHGTTESETGSCVDIAAMNLPTLGSDTSTGTDAGQEEYETVDALRRTASSYSHSNDGQSDIYLCPDPGTRTASFTA